MNTPSSEFKLIQELSGDPDNCMSITELCALNHVCRSGYYNWLKQENARIVREEQDRKDFDLILEVLPQPEVQEVLKEFTWDSSTADIR